MRPPRPAPLLLWLLAAACAAPAQLVPAPGTPMQAAGVPAAEAGGVRLEADADAWRGSPRDLEAVLTPVHVRVENRSGRPLRVGPAAFELVGDSGFRFAALPPLSPREGQAALGLPGPAPVSGWHAPAPDVWGGPWEHRRPWRTVPPWWDPFWPPGGWGWGPSATPRVLEPLPTRDMVRLALPDGTLEDGASISGFLYFPDVGGREQRVVLTASLTDARSGEAFGTLRIPFRVQP